MSIATGVDAGSMLVPELVWLSSDSMRVVGGFIMSIDVAGVPGGIGVCEEGWFIPGMSGMGDGLSCARMNGVAKNASESRVAGRVERMLIPSLEDCGFGKQHGQRCKTFREQERSQIRRAMRGGCGGDAVSRAMQGVPKGATFSG